MIRSLSSSLCALSSSSADVNTFMLRVRSNLRCRRAERSEALSQSESESLESDDELGGCARFLTGGRWRCWQSVRQEIWTTRAKSVRKRPKHTPQTKKSAALSGWSGWVCRRGNMRLSVFDWEFTENTSSVSPETCDQRWGLSGFLRTVHRFSRTVFLSAVWARLAVTCAAESFQEFLSCS